MREEKHLLDRIFSAFPFIETSGEEVRHQIIKHGANVKIPKGKIIFLEGDDCKQLALILSGVVRVYKPAESGREITLYRLGKGESCVLTASCIFTQNSFPAVAVADEEIEAVVIPSNIFRDWINQYEIWRNYVFNLLSKRLSEVITTLEEVAFRRMDLRIAEFLVKSSGPEDGGIRTTHQDIAMELGTSREVVSRILKHLEYEGLISLSRGIISIRDIDGLTKKMNEGRLQM